VLTEYLARDYVTARPLGEKTFWCTLFAAVRAFDEDRPYVRDFVETARETAFQLLHGIREVS
jgi:LysR family transcriptional regulator for metE and metH